REKPHFVTDVLPEHARIKLAPAKLAKIIYAHGVAAVADHIHELIDVALIGDVLVTQFDGKGLPVIPRTAGDGVIFSLVQRIQHLVAIAVVVALRAIDRTAVADTEIFIGQRGTGGGAHRITDALVVARQTRRVMQGTAALRRIHRRCRFDDDGAGNAVAAEADRRDAGNDLDRAHLTGIDIGQRGIHVIGAG